MRPGYRRATLLACSALVAGVVASPASARHARHHHPAKPVAATAQDSAIPGKASLYAVMRADYARKHKAASRGRRSRVARRHARGSAALAEVKSSGGLFTNALVADARKYIGTNPTNRRTLWCGAFVDKILRDTGHKGGGISALGYLHYGRRVSGPQVGSIAVMRRRGGGHVGVVAGVDANGNPIIISGNHNHTTEASVYPRHRILAYVVPTHSSERRTP
jgi:uncharacterized protein (TIGR02594 family)